MLLAEATLCGPRALQAICRKWGKAIALRDLIEWSGWGPEGTSFAGLQAAAQRVGWRARGVRTTIDRLPALLEDAQGAILQIHDHHFVALLDCDVLGRRSLVADPKAVSVTTAWWTRQYLHRRWTGNALILVRADG